MNELSYSSILVIVANFFTASILFAKSKGRKYVIIWAIFCLSIIFWGIGAYFASIADTKIMAYRGWQIANVTAIFTPVIFCHFVCSFLNLNRKLLVFFFYSLGVLFFGINLFLKEKFLGDLMFVHNQFFYISWDKHVNPIYMVFYIIFYWGLLPYSFFELLRGFLKSQSIKRTQMKYFILGTAMGWLGAHSDFLSVFNPKIYPHLNFLCAVYTVVIGYAIVKYRLMDITLVLTRAGIFIAVYSLILGIPFALAFGWRERLLSLIGENWWMVPLVSSTVLATVGPFIYIYFQRKAEGRLLKEQRRYQATLRQASSGMGRIKDIRRLLQLLVHISTRAVGLKHASAYVYDDSRNHFILGAARNRPQAVKIIDTIPKDSSLVQYLNQHQTPLVYEELKQHGEDSQDARLHEICEELEKLDAGLVVANFIEGRLKGILVLGSKRSGKLFSEDDLAAFSILANQAALAMENLKSLEEMKKAQEKLFQAEKLAYVGQLASSVVHEVRNPLTAIKTFVNYLPEKFRARDLGFLERFEAIIPKEIQRIDIIVHELLDLAKPRRLKKSEVKISGLVSMTLESLKDNFQLKKIRVEYECLLEDDKIFCDEEQIQQVLLNLFLNAMEAMPGGGVLSVAIRREVLSEAGAALIAVVVKDTGCGIPQDKLQTLFTPFQTTKKEGVGLGLVITKEIVSLHGGEIRVESKPGEGAQFTVLLPVK